MFADETHKYGKLAVKDMTGLINVLDGYWRCDAAERREVSSNILNYLDIDVVFPQKVLGECFSISAIASLFNWMNAQAHCLG